MRIKIYWFSAVTILVLGGLFVWPSFPKIQEFVLEKIGVPGPTKASPAAGQARFLPPVATALVEQGPQPIEMTAIGSVQALETVGIKSRIDGIILEVHITDGQEVREGDLLFTIESRTLEAQLRQAEANLQRDQTVFENAKRTLDRQQALALKNIASQSALDTAQTAAAAADQAIKATQAQVEALRINLGYTRLIAPISGRAGEIKLTKGNLVKANDPVSLVTLRKLRPISLAFSVPQKYFFELRDAMKTRTVRVTAQIPDQPSLMATGEVTFYDTSLDPTTGAFQVKAIFANQDSCLWPGMFTPLTVHLGHEADAISVPNAAVQIGQEGPYVYVIPAATGDPALHRAELRPITVARTVGARSIVAKGLIPGETVVTDGQLRLTDGARVDIRPLKALSRTTADRP